MAFIKTVDKKIRSQKTLIETLFYVTNSKKTSLVTVSQNDTFISVKDTAFLWEWTRKHLGKDNGVIAHHFIQSFSPDDKMTTKMAEEIAKEFAEKAFSNYQYLIATHTDREHLHNHIILNSVNLVTSKKWYDNKESLQNLRNLSDEICSRYNLSIIKKSDNKGIDRATYRAALQGKSWKVEIIKTLDEAVLNCKTKLDFINFLNKKGYLVKYNNKHITITKKSDKESTNRPCSVRVDTLAKQFGEKYTKENLEKSMSFYLPPTKREQEENWKRYEEFIFSEKSKKKKPTVIENDNSYGNIVLERLLTAVGDNFTGEINLLDIIKLKNADFFFSGRKKESTAEVTFKRYNRSKFEKLCPILREVETIINTNISQNKPLTNSQIYSKIKHVSELNSEKPSYKIITQKQLEILKNTELEFAAFKTKDSKFNIVFLKENTAKINTLLKGTYEENLAKMI